MATIAKTVGSFDKVLESCKTIGTQYQPIAAELSPAALSSLRDRVQQSLEAVIVTQNAHRIAVAKRKESFKGIPQLAMRVVRTLAATRTEEALLENAISIKNKFHSSGKRQQSDKVVTTSTEGVVLATRASGNLAYEQRMKTLRELVELVSQIGSYRPVEPDLTLPALNQKIAELRSRSEQLVKTQAAFKEARLQRDELIDGKDGIRAIARAVRNYIHGAFGTKGHEANHIKGNVV